MIDTAIYYKGNPRSYAPGPVSTTVEKPSNQDTDVVIEAKVSAIADTNGQISSLTITNPGLGYSGNGPLLFNGSDSAAQGAAIPETYNQTSSCIGLNLVDYINFSVYILK